MGLIFKIERDKTKEEVTKEMSNQVELIKDAELVNKISKYLVEPTQHLAIWDYSENKDKYPVWLILKSEGDDTTIIYSEYGFDFGNWGLITLSDQPFHFGPDYGWFPTLKEAFENSWMFERA